MKDPVDPQNNPSSFDQHFRETFEQAKRETPAAMWADLATELASKNAARHTRKIVLLRRVAAAAIFLLIALGITFSLTYKTDPVVESQPVVKPESPPQEPESPKASQGPDEPASITPTDVAENPASQRPATNTRSTERREPVAKNQAPRSTAPGGTSPSPTADVSGPITAGLSNRKPDLPGTLPEDTCNPVAVTGEPIPDQPTPDSEGEEAAKKESPDRRSDSAVDVAAQTEAPLPLDDPALDPGINAPQTPDKLQDPLPAEPVYAGFWVSSVVAPAYTYQSFSADNTPPPSGQHFSVATQSSGGGLLDQYAKQYQAITKPKLAFTGGFEVGYAFNVRWEIRSGFLMAERGENSTAVVTNVSGIGVNYERDQQGYTVSGVEADNIYAAADESVTNIQNIKGGRNQPKVTSLEYEDPAGNDLRVNYKYLYYDVPLVLQYNLHHKKTKIYFSGGASVNFFRKNTIVTHYDHEQEAGKFVTQGQDYPFKSVNYSMIVSAGMEFSLSKKLGLNLEPSYTRAIRSITHPGYIQGKPYSVGLNTGLRYHF